MPDQLQGINSVIISQKKEWGEIVTGFETKNKYSIQAPSGKEIYLAAEQAGGTLARFFLRHRRAWIIHILDKQGQPVLILKKPFRWFFDELNILNLNGQIIGKLKWEFHFLKKVYAALDSGGQEIYNISGPLFRPWTFYIKKKEQEVGRISKKWSGIKELFSTADNFSLTFPNEATLEHKSILLGAVFLIDFNYFEARN